MIPTSSKACVISWAGKNIIKRKSLSFHYTGHSKRFIEIYFKLRFADEMG